MSTKYGGPAFPVTLDDFREFPDHPAPGMSLRDWFAGQAMAHLGLVLFETIRNTGEVPTIGQVASLAYELADAMLAVREKGASS